MRIDTIELFPVTSAGPTAETPSPAERKAQLKGLSPGARRTLRRRWDIEDGIHPLTRLPLHVLAPTDASPSDRYPRPYTCGTCVHKIMRDIGHKTLAKCDKVITYSEASDLRNWLPACECYRPTKGTK